MAKKIIYILFIMLLVGCFDAMAQKPIKRQNASKQKTEKTSKSRQSGTTSNGDKSKKTNKSASPQSSINSNSPINEGTVKSETITANGVSFTMVYVSGGTYTMGATAEQGNDADSNEKPAHQVSLPGYYIGKYEVTQELWQSVMGNNPSWFPGESRCPVECVSWEDCQKFITKLNKLTGKTFRLPTEAEWEYAARGGNRSHGYKYAGSNSLGDVAWYEDNSSDKTHPVGQKSPNELGLYDMSGNASEWCQDLYGNYSGSSQTDPVGSYSGYFRVSRGGAWFWSADGCRVSLRSYDYPDIPKDVMYVPLGHGLRLAASSL